MKKTAAKEETKQALIQAFWKLYREKRIEKITVGEIAAVAGYNRSTFYEYFYDVPDVLQQIEDCILDEMQFGIPGDRIPLEDVVAIFETPSPSCSANTATSPSSSACAARCGTPSTPSPPKPA